SVLEGQAHPGGIALERRAVALLRLLQRRRPRLQERHRVVQGRADSTQLRERELRQLRNRLAAAEGGERAGQSTQPAGEPPPGQVGDPERERESGDGGGREQPEGSAQQSLELLLRSGEAHREAGLRRAAEGGVGGRAGKAATAAAGSSRRDGRSGASSCSCGAVRLTVKRDCGARLKAV